MTEHIFFGLGTTLLAYALAQYIQKKTRSIWANPTIVAMILLIALLLGLGVPLEHYRKGGDLLTFFIAPATAALALGIYQQRALLRRYWLPMVGGSLSGSLVSILSIKWMAEAFGLNRELLFSLLPKSTTTAIALPLSAAYGGVVSLTVLAVILTGQLGALLGPLLAKWLKIEPLPAGLAIGTASHALGTVKALEMGEVQGAASGIAIGLCGLFSVFWLAILF